jgi:transcriptional regulator with XRE-family HTH domain
MSNNRAKLRKRAGLSLTQLSRSSGVSVSRLSLYERGEGRLADHEVARIACVLNEALGTTPTFASDTELEHFLAVSGA